MTKNFDKQFDKARELIEKGYSVGTACKIAKIKYNTYHARMKKMQERLDGFEEIVGENKGEKKKSEKVEKVKMADVKAAFDDILEILYGYERFNNLINVSSSLGREDLITVLKSIEKSIHRKSYV